MISILISRTGFPQSWTAPRSGRRERRLTQKALESLRMRGKDYSFFSALLIGKLGLSVKFKRKGVGSKIIAVWADSPECLFPFQLV
jgi:hypothetical protein